MNKRTAAWPSTEATIVAIAGDKGDLQVSYWYEVDGERYGGYCRRRLASDAGAGECLDSLIGVIGSAFATNATPRPPLGFNLA